MATKTTGTRLKKLPLSVKLGVANLTLHKHLMKEGAPKPDAKRRYDVEEVKAWLAAESSANVAGSEIRGLRERKLRLEVEQLERESAIARGELIKRSEIIPTIAAFNAELVTNLRQKFEIELPQRCVGLGRIEIQQLNAGAIDFVIERLKAGEWALCTEGETVPAVDNGVSVKHEAPSK